jgi:hypothetical protein
MYEREGFPISLWASAFTSIHEYPFLNYHR